MARLTCRDVILDHLDEYIDGTLAPEICRDFEQHLTRCPACVAYLNTYRHTRELTRRSGAVEVPGGMRMQLCQFLLDRLRDA